MFAAAELSYDHDWMRFRLSGAYASGDHHPYDNTENGFDAIVENPIFAGADTSYWIRQAIPFAGGGRVISISGRNGLLNDLRSSKDEGQSNFNNPGPGPRRRRRRFRRAARVARVGQRQPPVVRKYRGAADPAQRRQHSARYRLGSCPRRRSGGPRRHRISSRGSRRRRWLPGADFATCSTTSATTRFTPRCWPT